MTDYKPYKLLAEAVAISALRDYLRDYKQSKATTKRRRVLIQQSYLGYIVESPESFISYCESVIDKGGNISWQGLKYYGKE